MKTKVEAWYGNGPVYLANEHKVRFLGEEINYDMHRIDSRFDGRGDWWVPWEVMVAVGTMLKPREAIAALRNVLRAMEKQVEVQSKKDRRKRTRRR